MVAFDLALVCLTSSVLAAALGMNLWTAVAVIGLGYAAIGNACFGQSIGACVQHKLNARLRTRTVPQTPVTAILREVKPIARKRAVTFPQAEMNREPETERRRASA
jgi:hypothetical protein